MISDFISISMFLFFSLHHYCASTSLLICVKSQVETKIKNDLNKCMYLYIRILKRTNIGKLTVWIYSGSWEICNNWSLYSKYFEFWLTHILPCNQYLLVINFINYSPTLSCVAASKKVVAAWRWAVTQVRPPSVVEPTDRKHPETKRALTIHGNM